MQARQRVQAGTGDGKSEPLSSDDSEDEEKEVHAAVSDDHNGSPTDSKRNMGPVAEGSSVAEDVIGRRGQYGRFAERWFSRKGWGTERRRAQGMSTEELEKTNPKAISRKNNETADQGSPSNLNVPIDSAKLAPDVEQGAGRDDENKPSDSLITDNIGNTLLPKLLRTTKMVLASGNFFFSYDYDITRRFGSQGGYNTDIPLHRAVDPLVMLPYFSFIGARNKLMFSTVFLESSLSSAIHKWLPLPTRYAPNARFCGPENLCGQSSIPRSYSSHF